MNQFENNNMGLLEPWHIFFVCWLILVIPLTIWGYRAASKRKIGAGMGMLLSIIFGLLGIAIIYSSSKKDDKIGERKHYAVENAADQLKKFKDLLDRGAITEAEYNIQKEKILNA
jgi:hypothetical protein